jgi:hypothetical protein
MSSAREKRNCHRRDCHEILYLELLLKFSEIFIISLKPYKCKTLCVVMYVQLCYLAVDDSLNIKTLHCLRGTIRSSRETLFITYEQITNKIHFSIYHIFYSINSHQHVSAAIPAIFRVMLLLVEYKGTNVVSCVAVTP